MVAVVPARPSDREVLRSQLSDYLVEFAAMEGIQAAHAASPGCRWFDD